MLGALFFVNRKKISSFNRNKKEDKTNGNFNDYVMRSNHSCDGLRRTNMEEPTLNKTEYFEKRRDLKIDETDQESWC